jgi:2'-5' RNA ligase
LNPNLVDMTGYHDYLIVLSPSENVINSVKQLKNSSARVIGEYESRYSTAHITIRYCPRKNSSWIAPMTTKLIADLQKLPSVILNIEGFSSFKTQTNATIYAKLHSSPLTAVWFKLLGRFVNKNDIIPHITIAKNIPLKAYNKLWPYFEKLEWNEHLKIDQVTILRRETIGHDKSYKVFQQIPFNQTLDFYSFTNPKIKLPSVSPGKVCNEQFSLF